MIDETHDPARRSWVESANAAGADFPIQNLPLGVFRRRESQAAPAIGVAIGDQILDLRACAATGLLDNVADTIREGATASSLNALMVLERGAMSSFRRALVTILDANGGRVERRCLVAMDHAEMLLPAAIGDYTDFYASLFHATRVGELVRPQHPLTPNYKHLPIAYHGRASSIVLSGTPIVRPSGQTKAPDDEAPRMGPSQRVDYELEIGCFVRGGNRLGEPIPIDAAEDRIFGLCIVNDWSARDIQLWESQPLGPFLSKSFATSVSPWVVTDGALAPFRCAAFARAAGDPRPLPYLLSDFNESQGGFDVTVEVAVHTGFMRRAGTPAQTLSRSSLRNMYWTVAQMIAHHTSNGCNLKPGDLLASGTISGSARGTEGCLLEMTRNGSRPIELAGGERLSFLSDGDEVIMRAFCEREGFVRIGFGECRGMIVSRDRAAARPI